MHKHEEAKIKLEAIDSNTLVEMCNEIYDWHWNSDGSLKQDGLVRSFAEEYFEKDAYVTEDHILHEAHRRFNKTVKLLFIHRPSYYITK
jgi:hypothetical protein